MQLKDKMTKINMLQIAYRFAKSKKQYPFDNVSFKR